MKESPKVDVLAVLNSLVEIHNLLIEGNEKSAFFHLGGLTENLAARLRNDNDSSQDKEAT